jgi:hypothetical protein
MQSEIREPLDGEEHIGAGVRPRRATMREVWIDQNADRARLVADGWWPKSEHDDEELGGEG